MNLPALEVEWNGTMSRHGQSLSGYLGRSQLASLCETAPRKKGVPKLPGGTKVKHTLTPEKETAIRAALARGVKTYKIARTLHCAVSTVGKVNEQVRRRVAKGVCMNADKQRLVRKAAVEERAVSKRPGRTKLLTDVTADAQS